VEPKRKGIRKLVYLIRTGKFWELELPRLGEEQAKKLDRLKVMLIAGMDFRDQRIGLRAVNLAFSSCLALVPTIALAFFITQGFGLSETLEQLLMENFSEHQDIVAQVMSYADNVIEATNHGIAGKLSFLLFIWLLFWLMIQVESAFNYAMKTQKPRKIWKRIGVYAALAVTLPFIAILFLSTMLQFSGGNGLASYINFPFWEQISGALSWLIIYAVVVLALSVMYKFIPSIYIPFRFALKSALVTGIIFCLFQAIYVATQMFFNRLNGVFGAMAAVPFLMIWLNFSWFIVLLGAKLVYAYMNRDEYKPE